MTRTTPLTSPHPSGTARAAGIDRAERDHDWHATTGEAIARLDDAIATISAHVDAVDTDAMRGHITGQLTAALTILEQLAEHLAAPTAGDDAHPF
ncbi:hypothetical protein [Microbacterium sp. KRD172]|uniref:hypothetical protein n=1 Tax=Microbacterium sp. KRD172 TaxID=2729727 RepID=UPI0019D1BAA1|nr:hypothetical protein [Microbacterium sp. KRD172]